MTDSQDSTADTVTIRSHSDSQVEQDNPTAWLQHIGCSPTVCRAILPVVSHELDLPPSLFHDYHSSSESSKALLVSEEFDAVLLLSPTHSAQSELWSEE